MQIIKLILLQTYWYVSIKYGSNVFVPFAGLILWCLDFLFFREKEKLQKRYVIFSVVLILSGMMMDQVFNVLGALKWGDKFYPLELVGVWVIFPAYYYQFFRKFKNPKWLSFVMGAVFGPVAYVSGGRINSSLVLSLELPYLIIISVLWGVFFKVSLDVFVSSRSS